jgi:hypothetical protein
MGRRGKNRIYEVWKAFPDRAVFDQFWATEKGEWTRRKAYEAKGLVQMTSELWDCRYCSTVNRGLFFPIVWILF